MIQKIEQFNRGEPCEIERLKRGRAFGFETVNAAVTFIDFAFLIVGVSDLGIVPIGNINGSIGTDFDIDGPEPLVGAGDGVSKIHGAEGGTVWSQVGFDNAALEWFDAKKLALIL